MRTSAGTGRVIRLLVVALAGALLATTGSAPAASAAPGSFSKMTIWDTFSSAAGWAELRTTNVGTRDLSICPYPNYLGALNVEIDPGSGHLALYTKTAGGTPCLDTEIRSSIRKYRTWLWELPPRLTVPNEEGAIVIDDNENGVEREAGYADITTNAVGTARSLLLCTFYNGTVYAEIDPGNGQLVTYAATPQSGCVSRDLGANTRKFRAFIWQLPPSL